MFPNRSWDSGRSSLNHRVEGSGSGLAGFRDYLLPRHSNSGGQGHIQSVSPLCPGDVFHNMAHFFKTWTRHGAFPDSLSSPSDFLEAPFTLFFPPLALVVSPLNSQVGERYWNSAISLDGCWMSLLTLVTILDIERRIVVRCSVCSWIREWFVRWNWSPGKQFTTGAHRKFKPLGGFQQH